jgi:hypothetical protein
MDFSLFPEETPGFLFQAFPEPYPISSNFGVEVTNMNQCVRLPSDRLRAELSIAQGRSLLPGEEPDPIAGKSPGVPTHVAQ